MIVLDTSVWFDLFSSGERKEKAERLVHVLEEKKTPILEPFIFKIEFSALLSRKYRRDYVLELVQSITDKVILLPNPDRLALGVALDTGCRAVDSYFIALAKLTDFILIKNDKPMTNNAKKLNIRTYYLIQEFEEAIKVIEEHSQMK